MKIIKLRDYQEPPVQVILAALLSVGRALACMATGLGKTVVIAFLLKNKELTSNGRVLVLCHDSKILAKSRKTFEEVLEEDGITCGEFHGRRKDDGNPDILFATFQMMLRYKEACLEDEFTTIIVDEGHHAQAPTYKEVIDYFTPKYLLALTATPDRVDGTDIRDIFGEEVVNIPLEEAVGKGWLPSFQYRVLSDGIDRQTLKALFTSVVEEGKKVSLKQLNETLFIQKRDEEMARIILEQDQKRGIVFCESIQDAEQFQEFLPGSVCLHSKMSLGDQDDAHEGFQDGTHSYILVVDKYNEGVDVPETDLIVFRRCTDSQRIFLQQLGRGLHANDVTKNLVVLDFVANCDRIQMVKGLSDRILDFVPNPDALDRNPLHVSGEAFEFVFDEEQVDILQIISALKPTYVSDIPHLLAEYHPTKNALSADKVTAAGHKKAWWKCSICAWDWESRIKHRVDGTGCPACAGRVVTPKNNLVSAFPDIAKEYHPTKNILPACEVYGRTTKKVWWKCSMCSHEWLTQCVLRTRDNRGCPGCSNTVATKSNNLTVTHPELAREYHTKKNELPANKIIAGGRSQIWWVCSKCQHEWRGPVRARSRVNGTGCPECSRLGCRKGWKTRRSRNSD